MPRCKHCQNEVTSFPHHCPETDEVYDEDDGSDFLLSMAIGAITDNALLGGIIGGDPLGGLLGDVLNDGDLF